MRKLIAIVIPVFNEEKHLDICINSVINKSIFFEAHRLASDEGNEDVGFVLDFGNLCMNEMFVYGLTDIGK